MASKKKRFADDGWAIWIDGDDTSTVYINDWLDPKGESYVDIAIRISGIMISTGLHVYVPFVVSEDEIEDVSLKLENENLLRATFSAACIIDYKKNEMTSEIAYNAKTMDLVHISGLGYSVKPLASGTVIDMDLTKLHPYLDNESAYFLWRMPHRSLNEVFGNNINMRSSLTRLRDLLTTPVIAEKYGYSIRINESRLLPPEINRLGAFHRQKLKKSVITISIDESYELNDSGCYRIRRLEEDLYRDYLPKNYNCEDVITYQWNQSRESNFHGQFNYYFNIGRNSVSQISMLIYMVLLLAVGIIGNFLSDLVKVLFGLDW